jgi:hypothetical protein
VLHHMLVFHVPRSHGEQGILTLVPMMPLILLGLECPNFQGAVGTPLFA